MKKTFLLITFALAIWSVQAQTATTDPGVIINGVKWATRNVDEAGTFAATPESAGKFYQWNRNKAWSTEGSRPVLGWDDTDATGTNWEEVNDPCPAGWHVPTFNEYMALLDSDKVVSKWITQNGVKGRNFTDKETGVSLFLPAVGGRYNSTDVRYAGINGGYWGSMQSNVYYVDALSFGSDDVFLNSDRRSYGFSVRPVSDTPAAIGDVLEDGRKITAYYSILGVQLPDEPASGIYIVTYNNGTAEKRFNRN